MDGLVFFQPKLTKIYKSLRTEKEILGWRESSLYFGHYACAISSKQASLVVHHLTSFESIVKDTINEMYRDGIIDKSWLHNPYLTLELKGRFLVKHRQKGLGVVLHKKIHDEFHRLYGRTNNTSEQFEDFKKNITPQRVDEILKIPTEGDLICTSCNQVSDLLINNLCGKCFN